MRVIEEHVAALHRRGVAARLVAAGSQEYVRTLVSEIPVPPWQASSHEILIAIPGPYDTAALDGFYIALPHAFNGGNHPRVNGAVIELEGVNWQLVSWHYADSRPWRQGQDDVDSHLTHCRGFFLQRGATNAR